MDDNFTYFYPVKLLTQMSFEGKAFKIPEYGEGHIQYFGSLLCKAEKDKLTKKIKGDNEKIVKHPLPGKKMCPSCQELYKTHPHSAWFRFVNGQAIKTTPLPALISVPENTR